MDGRASLKLIYFFFIAIFIVVTGNTAVRAEQHPVTEEQFIDEAVTREQPTVIDPGDTWTQFTFGYQAYHREGDLQIARQRLERALAGDTGFARARYWLGKVHYALGENNRAVELWEQGREIFSGERRSWFEHQLRKHQLRYEPSEPVRGNWKLIYRLRGEQPGAGQNLNPTALAPRPSGGFFSSSYGLGRVLLFSEEGRQLERWRKFDRPIDLDYHPGLGLLIAEHRLNKLKLIGLDGELKIFADTELEAPARVFSTENAIYLFNSSTNRIVRFSTGGDYLGTVWQATFMDNITDVAFDSEQNFWLLNRGGNSLELVAVDGSELASYDLHGWPEINNIWWREENLYGNSDEGIIRIDLDGEHDLIRAQGEIISGTGVSDLLFSGDRLIISRYNEHLLEIYRPEDITRPDIIVNDERVHLDDYPVIRMNLHLADPLQTGRFEYLVDRNVGVTVEELRALPSLLRPTREYFSPSWILILDEGYIDDAGWREVRPQLNRLVEQAPQDSRGSLWSVDNHPTPAIQPSTYSRESLNYRMNQQQPQRILDPLSDETFKELLNNAIDLGFGWRGPTGIIVVSSRFNDLRGDYGRIARRLRNNSMPLFVVDPGVAEPSSDNLLLTVGKGKFFNAATIDTEEIWESYNRRLSRHYTAVFRSPIDRIEPGAWRRYQLEFHYLDSIFRFTHGYQLP